MVKYIDQMHPWFDEHEASAIYTYLMNGGWATEFKKTREFEERIAEYTGAKFCSIMPNGTISLSVALQAYGIGYGDDVLVPDYTMIATPNSVALLGANVIFVDVERDTMCLDYDKMLEAITPKTKAIMLVEINGRYPNKMDEIIQFCNEQNIVLIEDSAQALGSFRYGKHLGTFGNIGSFSFSAPKIISTGQGGALITNDEEAIKNIRLIRDFGRERGGIDHYLTKGWNYKFTDIQAIIGLEQMKKLSWRIERKKQIGKLYAEHLQGIPEVEVPFTNFDETSLWFFDILVNDRRGLKDYLHSFNIGSREFYPALHSEPAYGYYNRSFPITEEISKKGLWLPSSSDLSNEDIKGICEVIRNYYN